MQLNKNNGLLNLYLSATILANLLCLFLNGYGADLGYWENWTTQLNNQGYLSFNGNYPPVYIHWLYLVAKGLHYFQLPIEPNDLCKFLWELPVLISHCVLTWIVFQLLEKSGANKNQTLSIMLLTVFNPAILINGPVWGQVDLLPAVIALCAILIHFSNRYSVLMVPLFILALLTKFQMLCFSPIIGILFFQRIKTHIIGILLSLLVILAAFAPFMYVNYLKEAFNHAYIDTLGQYPVITMNAANLWVLLIGNNAPDSIPFLSEISPLLPQKLIYPKYLGMFLYAAVCLFIFILGLNSLAKHKRNPNDHKFMGEIFFSALVSAIAFFSLLPAMHERYLFPAIIAAIIFAAVTKKHLAYLVLLSLASAFNMLIILGINGSNIWIGLSSLVTAIFVISILELTAGNVFFRLLNGIAKKFFTIPYSSFLFFGISVSVMLYYLLDRHSIHQAALAQNQILLTNQTLVSATQSYGTMQYGLSVDKKPLSVGNRRFSNGIGTHSDSVIVFTLPENAVGFDVIPGIDDEIETTDLLFEIWEDDKLLWQSAPYYGFEKAINVHVDLHKGQQLTLKVDARGDKSWDHADWINPIITVDNTAAHNP